MPSFSACGPGSSEKALRPVCELVQRGACRGDWHEAAVWVCLYPAISVSESGGRLCGSCTHLPPGPNKSYKNYKRKKRLDKYKKRKLISVCLRVGRKRIRIRYVVTDNKHSTIKFIKLD